MNFSNEHIIKIGEVLSDTSRPLKERFRALFTLKNIGGEIAIKMISDCFTDSSSLLKHELAYCLGQMQDEIAVPLLIKVLKNIKENTMVRHEAAEALGAIASEGILEILEDYTSDSAQEVAETCQLAIDRIKWAKFAQENNKTVKSIYMSVDPAPPSDCLDVTKLRSVLLDENETLFERYKAMFALRDLSNKESIAALCEGLFVGSPLFRHEVAFVLGQIQNADAIPALINCLSDISQHEMVRHECAEALGSIATEACMEALERYLQDDSRVVRESCEVALDMAEYELSFEFQYANTASAVCA